MSCFLSGVVEDNIYESALKLSRDKREILNLLLLEKHNGLNKNN